MFRLCVALMVLGALSLCAPAVAGPAPVEAYGKRPAVEQISLSPSGQRYAFVAVVGETRTLVAMTADGKTALIAVPVGQAKVVDVRWVGEDHILVEVYHTVPLGMDFDVAKAEFATVISINLKTRKSIGVFEKHDQVSDIVEGTYGEAEIGGHWYGYFGGITYGADKDPNNRFLDHMWQDLYRVDLDTGAIDLVAHGSELAQDWLVGPDGQIIARTTYDERNGAWEVRSGGSGGRLLASGKSRIAATDSLSRGRSADTIVIDQPTADGSVYQEFKLSGEALADTPADSTVAAILADPVSRLWVGTVTQGDQSTPKFFDPVADARVRGTLKAFPGLSVSLVSFTPDLGRMIVETSGTGDSGTYWLVNIATHDAKPIGAEYPDVDPMSVGTIEMVDWKAADGLALRGVLNLPPGREPKNLPLVVMPHGGPEDRDYPHFWWWAQLFASRGYAVFQPNFRGSAGYGKPFRDAGFGQWGHKMQTDISDGVADLVKQGIVDPKRACIVGWSYGGYAAEAGVTVQHGLYRCAVSMAGVSDPQGMINYSRDKAAGGETLEVRYWKAFMGVTSDWRNDLAQISPAKLAAQADAPILLVHGKDDTIVPFEQSQELDRALRAAGKPVEFISLTGADHWLLKDDTRLAMAKASLDFVLKYDPPDPEPAPANVQPAP
jgi:dipeptidyl aminopeptidase/acylaminoacyl peptidase